jgi:hypothetical protein
VALRFVGPDGRHDYQTSARLVVAFPAAVLDQVSARFPQPRWTSHNCLMRARSGWLRVEARQVRVARGAHLGPELCRLLT